MQSSKDKQVRADLALAFSTLLWGATFVVVKNALDYSSVLVFLAVRFSLAALLMAAFRPRVLHNLKKKNYSPARLWDFSCSVAMPCRPPVYCTRRPRNRDLSPASAL